MELGHFKARRRFRSLQKKKMIVLATGVYIEIDIYRGFLSDRLIDFGIELT